ncbi:MAG: MnhB domain-containing protein [Candidatus Bipolaricaulota bacterium]
MDNMSPIVRTITGLVYGFILVFGFYVIMHGHLTPGGGFQGGAVVASGFALLLVAHGASIIGGKLREGFFSFFESLGALTFISLAFAGLGTTFFYNMLAGSGSLLFGQSLPQLGSNPGDVNTAGSIVLMNWGVGLKVLAGLGTVVLLLTLALREEEA